MHDLQIDFDFKIDLNLKIYKVKIYFIKLQSGVCQKFIDKQIDWRACFFWKRIVEDFKIWTLIAAIINGGIIFRQTTGISK